MTQYSSQYPGYPNPPAPGGYPPAPPSQGQWPGLPPEPERRRFPFIAGYALWFMPALWRDAGRRWRGIGFFYMLLLLAITWAVEMAKTYPSVADFVRTDVPKLATQVPAININKGVVTTDAPREPYVITNPDTGQVFGVIDTTGATVDPPAPAVFLLTRNAVVVRNNNKIEKHDLSGVQSFQMNGQDVQSWADALLAAYWPAGLPMVLTGSMLYRLAWMLLYGLIGLAVASSVRPALPFSALMRLAAIAMTPAILIDTLLWVTGLSPGCVWSILATIGEVVLLVFMIKSNDTSHPAAPGRGFTPGMYAPQPGYAAPGYAPPGYQPPPPQPPQPYNPPPPPPPQQNW